MSNEKHIVALRLEPYIIDQLDRIAKILKMPRASLIRELLVQAEPRLRALDDSQIRSRYDVEHSIFRDQLLGRVDNDVRLD